MQENNSYSQIVQLIRLTQTQSVAEAELKLNQAANNDPNLLNHLHRILKDESLQYFTKLASAAYINNALSQNYFKFTKQQTTQKLAQILVDVDVDAGLKRPLQRAIVNAIDDLRQPEITQFRELVFALMKDIKLRDTAYMVIGCFCIPDSIDIQHVIYLTKIFMLPTLRMIILPDSQQHIHVVKEYNQILKTWIVVWDRLAKQHQQYLKQSKKLKKKGKSSKPIRQPNMQPVNLLLEISQSQQLSSVIFNIYPWMCKSPMYICTQPNLQELNILKQQAAALHFRALKITYKQSIEVKIFSLTAQLIPSIINNLVIIATNQNALDEYLCRDFVVNLIKVVTRYLLRLPGAFSKQWKYLLSSVVFPLIKPTAQEKDMFENSPTEFVSIFEDSTQKQTYGIIKTQICHLLQKIADRSEAITQDQFIPNFIINFCVDSILAFFSQPVQNVYEMQFVGLDVAVTVICIFSFRLANHRAKLHELKKIFNKQFISAIGPYQRALIYLFLGYNFEELYSNPDEGAFFVEQALSQNSHETTKHCASDFIFNIADQYYSDFFFQFLSNSICTNDRNSVWDSMQKLIQTQGNKVSPALMIELMSNLYSRLQKQLQKVTKSSSQLKQTITILKVVNIFKSIAEQDNYCKQHQNVREYLWKIMNIYDKAVKLEFQDQLFLIMEALLKQETVISDKSKQALSLILHEFARNQYYETYFYKIINHFIMKSSSQVVLPILKSISTGIIFHSLNMGQSIKRSERRLLNGHLLLLLQNLLAIQGKYLTKQQIVEVSAIVVRYLPTKQDHIDCPTVLARTLNVLLLCHMYVKATNTWEYIYSFTQKQIYQSYDITVLLTLIKAQIARQGDPLVGAQMLVIAADVIKHFRKKQKADLASQKVKAKYGKDNRLKLVKYKQFQQILKYLQTPFKTQTKLQTQLTNLIQQLKQSNPEKFNIIASLIPQDKIQQICQLCKFQSGSLSKKRTKFTVIRPKAPQQVQAEQKQQSQNEEQSQEFKRKRVEEKKKRKQKTNNKIDAE